MPLRVAFATSSGVPLQVASHFEWRADCVAFAFQVAYATSSGVSHREHATSCHFEWPLQVACRTVSMPLHATSGDLKWREVAKSVYAPAAC